MKRSILFFILLILTVSCTTTYQASLKGKRGFTVEGLSTNGLISRFGAPTREVSDGRDGRILVFTGDRVFDYRASKYGGSLPELQCYMGPDDLCYRYETVNMESKRAFSAGKTILLLILLGILPLPFI